MRNQFNKAMHADGADCGGSATESGSAPRNASESARRKHGTLIATLIAMSQTNFLTGDP